MSTHTPGPWMWDSDPIKGDPLGRVRYRVVARGKTVTQCYYSSSNESAVHDARLIAAAPLLLEELQAAHALLLLALKHMDDLSQFAAESQRMGLGIDGATRHHERAAAIATATGANQ